MYILLQYMLSGIILTYNATDSYNITKLNNTLFGRVVKVKRKNRYYYYYYKGLLENTYFYKINKGCYFIYNIKDINNIINYDINIIKCNIDIKEDNLYTPNTYFTNKYNNVEVINL